MTDASCWFLSALKAQVDALPPAESQPQALHGDQRGARAMCHLLRVGHGARSLHGHPPGRSPQWEMLLSPGRAVLRASMG